jgi:hypothetical protein
VCCGKILKDAKCLNSKTSYIWQFYKSTVCSKCSFNMGKHENIPACAINSPNSDELIIVTHVLHTLFLAITSRNFINWIIELLQTWPSVTYIHNWVISVHCSLIFPEAWMTAVFTWIVMTVQHVVPCPDPSLDPCRWRVRVVMIVGMRCLMTAIWISRAGSSLPSGRPLLD